jgi:hypothetical protein
VTPEDKQRVMAQRPRPRSAAPSLTPRPTPRRRERATTTFHELFPHRGARALHFRSTPHSSVKRQIFTTPAGERHVKKANSQRPHTPRKRPAHRACPTKPSSFAFDSRATQRAHTSTRSIGFCAIWVYISSSSSSSSVRPLEAHSEFYAAGISGGTIVQACVGSGAPAAKLSARYIAAMDKTAPLYICLVALLLLWQCRSAAGLGDLQ